MAALHVMHCQLQVHGVASEQRSIFEENEENAFQRFRDGHPCLIFGVIFQRAV